MCAPPILSIRRIVGIISGRPRKSQRQQFCRRLLIMLPDVECVRPAPQGPARSSAAVAPLPVPARRAFFSVRNRARRAFADVRSPPRSLHRSYVPGSRTYTQFLSADAPALAAVPVPCRACVASPRRSPTRRSRLFLVPLFPARPIRLSRRSPGIRLSAEIRTLALEPLLHLR